MSAAGEPGPDVCRLTVHVDDDPRGGDDRDDELPGGDPDDGPIDDERSWAAYVALARRIGLPT